MGYLDELSDLYGVCVKMLPGETLTIDLDKNLKLASDNGEFGKLRYVLISARREIDGAQFDFRVESGQIIIHCFRKSTSGHT